MEFIPQVDTPLSSPPEDRWASFAPEMPTYGPSSTTSSMESFANHFNDMALSENTPATDHSDCIVCGQTAAQIKSEIVDGYLNITVAVGETAEQTEAGKSGMTAGTFLLMPGECRRPAMEIIIPSAMFTTNLSLVLSP